MTVHTPIESRTRGIPRWSLAASGLVFLAGAVFFATNLAGANPPIGGTPASSGGGRSAQAIIKAAGCQSCHGPDLAGQGIFPSLHGVKNGPVSANLKALGTAHPDNWANLWIAGTDPAVTGIDRIVMPVFGGPGFNLTADEISTVVDYLKTLP